MKILKLIFFFFFLRKKLKLKLKSKKCKKYLWEKVGELH